MNWILWVYRKQCRRIFHQLSSGWSWLPSVGKAGGILGGVRKDKFDVKEVSMGKFHVKITVFDVKLRLKWCWIIVYGAAHESEKEDF